MPQASPIRGDARCGLWGERMGGKELTLGGPRANSSKMIGMSSRYGVTRVGVRTAIWQGVWCGQDDGVVVRAADPLAAREAGA
jgi:hypothetical protein